jgi:hypothetical protein
MIENTHLGGIVRKDRSIGRMEPDLMVLLVVLLSLTDHCQSDTQIQRYIQDLSARATDFRLRTESGRNDTMYILAIMCTRVLVH